MGKKYLFPLCVAALLTLCSCGMLRTPAAPSDGGEGGKEAVHPSVEGLAERFTREEDKIVRFDRGGSSAFYASDGWSNGSVFGCTWRNSSAVIGGGTLSLTLQRDAWGFASGEYRSRGYYGYGFYSVSMKAAKCSGVISSFFTYTNRPWDEIDIEFLGKDTTGLQFNYYTKGVGGHEFYYALGFDGAEDFHEYAFDWRQDSITWYVDGKPVYRATENIPATPTQIMANVWNCMGVEEWSGAFDESALPATAQYEWFGYCAE